MTQVVRQLPDELVRVLFRLGGRRLVLVEGTDDVLTLNEWFVERRQDVVFHPAGGNQEVNTLLRGLAALRPDVTAYGIEDRDLADDADVQAALDDPAARRFLLPRYAIENYLLEPVALWNVLRVFLRDRLPFADPAEAEAHLLSLCVELGPIMAANYVLRRHSNALSLFHERYEPQPRAEIVTQTARRMSVAQAEADGRIAAREAVIDPLLATLDTAHTCVNGKHLLNLVCRRTRAIQAGLPETYLFSQLVEWRKNSPPIHDDLRRIIERRILGDT